MVYPLRGGPRWCSLDAWWRQEDRDIRPLDLQVRGSGAPWRNRRDHHPRTKPAAYGWNVVESSWTGEQADIVRADGGADRAKLEGWIQLQPATELFKAAGLDIDKMRAAANKRGLQACSDDGLTGRRPATITADHRWQRESRNVVGTIKGTVEAPNEHLLLMAHWDHAGKGTSDDPRPT